MDFRKKLDSKNKRLQYYQQRAHYITPSARIKGANFFIAGVPGAHTIIHAERIYNLGRRLWSSFISANVDGLPFEPWVLTDSFRYLRVLREKGWLDLSVVKKAI